MLLRNRIENHGAFLFRCRSFLPLILLVPLLIALPQSGLLEEWLGEAAEEYWDLFTILVAYAGAGIRIATVGFVPRGTSGRNTAEQRAEILNTTGFYSVVRNPIYLGNMVTLLGFVLAVKVWWLPLLVIPAMIVYYERIVIAEEAYLLGKFGSKYEAWAKETPAFLPKFRLWRRSDLPFSWRTVIRREYHGIMLIALTLTLIEALTEIVGDGDSLAEWVRDDFAWVVFFFVQLLVWIGVRTIRKKTSLLVVEGR